MLSPATSIRANGFSDFMAHTVHWGDFPTWLAAAGGLAAAIYAARAFKGVARQQALNDRIMRYQAYSQARQMVAGVNVHVFPTSATTPTVRRVELSNGSPYRIDSIRITALIGAEPCTIRVVLDTNMPEQTSRRSPGAVLTPNAKAIWELSQDTATIHSYVSCFFEFEDEAGGSWVIDDEGRLSAMPDGPGPRQRIKQRLKNLAYRVRSLWPLRRQNVTEID